MRSILARFSFVLLLCALPLAAQEAVSAAPDGGSTVTTSAEITVHYTGDLHGFFRLPDEQPNPSDRQSYQHERCPDPGSVTASEHATRFLEELRRRSGSSNDWRRLILLGTGDNFAPELLARTFAPSATGGLRYSKDQYSWHWLASPKYWELNKTLFGLGPNRPAGVNALAQQIAEGRGYIPADNVACFMRYAGYDAVVPGKLDFFFGVERLRYLARSLADQSDGEYRSVQMLGANLVVQTAFQDKRDAPKAADSRELAFRLSHPLVKKVSIKDGSSVLPWLQRVTVETQHLTALQLYLCKTTQAGNPNALEAIADCEQLSEFDPAGSLVLPKGASPGNHAHHFQFPKLDSLTSRRGENLGVCLQATATPSAPTNPPPPLLTGKDPKSTDYRLCVRFWVQQPFFQFGTPAEFRNPDPYALVEVAGTKLAIFGVVEGDLREHIGRLNFSWHNTDKKYQSEVSVVDPKEALEHMFQYFEREQCEKAAPLPGCLRLLSHRFEGKKIVLAQMEPEAAQRLAQTLRGKVDVVISKAQPELGFLPASGTQKLEVPDDLKRLPFLAIPPGYSGRTEARSQNLFRSLTVSRPASGTLSFQVTDTSRTLPSPVAGPDPFRLLVTAALARKGHTQAGTMTLAQVLPQLLLRVMMERTNADVALLQKRDAQLAVDLENVYQTRGLQAALDDILWKGDFLMTLSLPGSALKQVLEQGDGFDKQDSSALSLSHEADRGLHTLGVLQDPDRKEYWINGMPLEAARVYRVVTSDYLALADTGYPHLRDAALRFPVRYQDMPRTLHYLSGILCIALAPGGPCAPGADQEYEVDDLEQAPAVTATAPHPPGKIAIPASALLGSMSSLEQDLQERRRWSLEMEKGSVGLTLERHSGTEQERVRRFSGISIPQLGNKRSTVWDLDQKFKATWAGKHVDLFASEEFRYKQASIRDTANSAGDFNILDQSQNLFALEGGIYVHRGKPLPLWKLLLGARLEAQPFEPVVAFSLPDNTKMNRDFERRTKILGVAGVRRQYRLGFFEIGYQFGDEFGILERAEFNFNQANPFTCTPSASESLNQCAKDNKGFLSKDSDIRFFTTSRFRHGLFFNAKMSIPISRPRRLTYVMENEGDLYFHRGVDTTVDPLYLNVWKHSLSVPIYKNLSLEPKVEFFVFENKVGKNAFFSIGHSVTLNYTFRWFSGSRKRDAFLVPPKED